MRALTLASGSSGNCALLSSGDCHILIDAGISARRITACLRELGLTPGDLTAVLITHEHSDHICGLATLVKHFNTNILAPRTVANNICRIVVGVDDCIGQLSPGETVQVGAFSVTPFATLHDTPQSVGYRVEGDAAVGYCTDLGCVTDEVVAALRGVDAVFVEANHDERLLLDGPYPAYLKRRILSDRGHLSNAASARLAATLAESGTRYIALAHLSRENNIPALARQTVQAGLDARAVSAVLRVAPPDGFCGFDTERGALC